MQKEKVGGEEIKLWHMLTAEIRSTGDYLEDGDFDTEEEMRAYEAYANMLRATRAQMHLIYDL